LSPRLVFLRLVRIRKSERILRRSHLWIWPCCPQRIWKNCLPQLSEDFAHWPKCLIKSNYCCIFSGSCVSRQTFSHILSLFYAKVCHRCMHVIRPLYLSSWRAHEPIRFPTASRFSSRPLKRRSSSLIKLQQWRQILLTALTICRVLLN
jgi:hypothetical protein